MTLEQICQDPRFSELKTVSQRRGKRAEVAGYQMWFDGKPFQAHSLAMLAIVLSDYIAGPTPSAVEWTGTEF